MNKLTPKVSILVPVYNVSKYIRECLESLTSQTLREIEIICVDDGSTDDSLNILNEFAEKDKRIVIITKNNGGLPSARNAALNVARGEYVGFVDSDDYVSKDMFSVMYNNAIKDRAEIVVCGATPFPDTPKPSEWLIRALSPRDVRFSKFTEEMLFEETGARPFVWRMLVKRSLIEDNDIRFDESIVIGEDQSFQLRIYPRANRISFISDKLYFYRWWREGSIMNGTVYSNYSKKVLAHIALVEHIGASWSKTGDMEIMRKRFLEWSVDLLYNDLIKLPLSNRIDASKRICTIWNNYSFWSLKGSFSTEKEDMFDYIYALNYEKCSEPEISIVVTTNNSYFWFESCITSILNQTKKNIEVICINNGTDDETFVHMFNIMRKDYRVSLFNQDKISDIECWQLGLANSTGKYILFIDSSDRLIDSNALDILCSTINDDVAMVCYNAYCNYHMVPIGITVDSRKSCLSKELKKFASIHQLLFRVDYIYPLVKDIRDCSWMNEWMFMAKAQKGNGTISMIPDNLYEVNKMWIPDKIATWQANMILDAAIEIVKESWEQGYSWMQKQVISTLNSDYMIKMIVNNTRPCVKRHSEDPEGMASECGTWCKILNLNSIIDVSTCERSLLRMVEVYVAERHNFLDKIS